MAENTGAGQRLVELDGQDGLIGSLGDYGQEAAQREVAAAVDEHVVEEPEPTAAEARDWNGYIH